MFRAALATDEPILWEMLTYAASMTGPLEASIAIAKADTYLGSYVRDFGKRNGDRGLIIEAVGAAWLRLGGVERGEHAVATDTEPELAIGLRPEARGRGLGSKLLGRLIEEAPVPAIVLSVRSANPSVRLYERHGFQVLHTVVNRVGGESLIMRREGS